MTAISSRLSYKLTAVLVLVLTLISLFFLFLLQRTYHMQLQAERRQASEEVNLLLEASLENAMLKRDIPGLQEIVDRLGQRPSMLNVSILNVSGEVRFSSDHAMIGKPYQPPLQTICPECSGGLSRATESTQLLENSRGKKIFRSVNPVKNREACRECHGSVNENPVNGILVVDYDAEPVVEKARSVTMGLLFAGAVSMGLTIFTIGWFMRRHVIKPVQHLKEISEKLASGDLSARADTDSKDEFRELANSYNFMAERLDKSLQQLLEKESYLQALIDAIPDGIRVIDENFQVVNANRAYLQQLQLTPDEVIGEPCYQSSHHRQEPCVPTLIACPVVEIGKKARPIKTMQNFIDRNGEYSEVQVFAAPLQIDTQDGRRLFVVESIRDLEKEINFSHEQKLSALGQLSAGVGHEIRNPLGSIRIALQSTMQKLKNHPDNLDDVMHYLELVDGEIDKCVSVTERLLKLSALPSEQKELVDIHQAIEDTLQLLEYEREKSGIDLQLDLDAEKPRVLAAESDIRMLFINLAQNAFHALYQGGALIVVTKVRDGNVEISFRDTGPGISTEHKPHIFEPFFSRRVDGTHGTGLGLTISKSIAERHGGTIRVRDVNPHGAEFIVTLPLADTVMGDSTENE